MMRKRELPRPGELVIGKIVKINPNSAFIALEEHGGVEGMVHISEIASGWVRDIRSHIKVGQVVVAKVLHSDRGISLSLKRVDSRQAGEKTKEFNLEKKAEKMLEIAAAKMKISSGEIYKQIGFSMQDNFGSLYEGFLKALKNPDALRKRGIDEKWIALLREVAEKNIEQKEFEFRAKLLLRSAKADGIVRIRRVLAQAEGEGLEVRYISAPEYLVRYRTKNAKKGEKDFAEKLEKLAASKEADVRFEIEKG